MDGYSVALSLIALFVAIGCLLMMGYYKRYDFNYKLGQAMERGLTTFPERTIYRRVLLRCLLFPMFGWLWLIGWWWAENYGLKEGMASIGKTPKPKPVNHNNSG